MISSLQLARLCGLSQGTIDRALHDRAGISKATKQRILAEAARHGYRPHPAARELLTGQRRTVAAVIPALSSLFFMDLMNAIRQRLAGFRFVITTVDDADGFVTALEEFAAARARLVVAVPPVDEIEIPSTITHEMPVISLVNRSGGRGVVNLIPDEAETGRIAARYLLKMGHRSIIHLRPTRDTAAIRDRQAGFEREMARRRLPAPALHGLDGDALVCAVRWSEATAIFCHNDWLALRAVRALNRAQIKVPEDVSVLGVDDSPTFVELFPEMTTLHYPAESIAQAIERAIHGRPIAEVAKVHVVERQTVRPPRGAS